MRLGGQSYLTVSVRGYGQAIVVQLDGELDLASSPQLEQALEPVWRDSPDELVLDLDQLRFMDMAGLRVLLNASQRADRGGTELVLRNVRDQILRVLTLTGVDGLLPIRGNRG